jgi:ubiquinone/menaquinone biosynthesis C-methylase UbiE
MGNFEKEWRERFERFAQSYNDDHLISGWSCNGLRRRLALFEETFEEQKLPIPSKILDLGCGGGTYVRYLASLGHKVVGIDYSINCLNRASAADKDRTSIYLGGDAYDLPFYKESFDLVVAIGVLQALDNPKRALDEMVRVLRTKGILVVEFLNALELIALSRSAIERLTGKLPRVRTYSPFQISRWLEERNLRYERRVGVYLQPRSLSSLGCIFKYKGVIHMIDRIPGLSLACAHAFLLVGKKEFTRVDKDVSIKST